MSTKTDKSIPTWGEVKTLVNDNNPVKLFAGNPSGEFIPNGNLYPGRIIYTRGHSDRYDYIRKAANMHLTISLNYTSLDDTLSLHLSGCFCGSSQLIYGTYTYYDGSTMEIPNPKTCILWYNYLSLGYNEDDAPEVTIRIQDYSQNWIKLSKGFGELTLDTIY